ncbi:MAG TPA: hypothetical protein VJO33_13170 [Gemmatimonadaceae bacterium]|nr:hypothetical protein [Gemmatimonadaceae bacterium]
MTRSAMASAIVVMASTVAAAQPPHMAAADTIVLPVGSASVDGTIYRDHEAAVVIRVLRDGAVVRTQRFINQTFATTRNGRAVCVVRSVPYAGDADQQFFAEVVLDRKTMALIHYEARDGTGRETIADVEGSHVTGHIRASRDAATQPLDFTLEAPSYYFPFVDAAIGATPLKLGQVFRVPSFGFGAADRHTEWRTYELSRRESVAALGAAPMNSWILEGRGSTHQTIWITDDAPYLPRVVSHAPDGSIIEFESALLATRR